MKDTQSFEEAFKEQPKPVRDYNKIFPQALIGAEIVDLMYGPDQDGDPCLYYIKLSNGIKIGMTLCTSDEKYEDLDRTKTFEDGSFIRFQYHDWPDEHLPKKDD